MTQSCGSCKWLTGGVEPSHIKKDGTIKEHYRFTAFYCSVPFEAPKKVPACIKLGVADRRYMMPYYGVDCAFYERRGPQSRSVEEK